MARLSARLDENAPGAFFVDDSCIDCDACRQIAPETFVRSRRLRQSIVAAQPDGGDRDDAAALPVEHRVTGRDPIVLDEELTIVPVPGHTRGSIALSYRDKFLFTGDHLWWDEVDERLDMGREVCWYSWSDQIRSLERLRDLRFEWVLPGHGRRIRARSAEAMRTLLEETIVRLGR